MFNLNLRVSIVIPDIPETRSKHVHNLCRKYSYSQHNKNNTANLWPIKHSSVDKGTNFHPKVDGLISYLTIVELKRIIIKQIYGAL